MVHPLAGALVETPQCFVQRPHLRLISFRIPLRLPESPIPFVRRGVGHIQPKHKKLAAPDPKQLLPVFRNIRATGFTKSSTR